MTYQEEGCVEEAEDEGETEHCARYPGVNSEIKAVKEGYWGAGER